MRRTLVIILVPILAVILFPDAAQADCTDPAEPGVRWVRCLKNGLQLGAVDLEDARLSNSSFSRADLSGANMRNIDGRRAKFVSANLAGVNLAGAILREADFTSSNLSKANLTGADLRDAAMFRADLREANLTGARLDGADFLMADLSGATWTNGTTVCAEGSLGQCK